MGALTRTLARSVRKRVIARIPRLPDATGDQGVVQGAAPAVRLALIGDSAAAGVGTRTHEEALAGHLAHEVGRLTGREIAWRVSAESGATARQVGRALVRDLTIPLEGWRPDVVVVIVGVNDIVRWRSLAEWRQDTGDLFAGIRRETPRSAVLVSGVAPLDRFPAIAAWARPIAARRVRAMDDIMAESARRHGVVHVPVGQSRREAAFAEDGFHLSSTGYRDWARLLAFDVSDLIESRTTAAARPSPGRFAGED